MPYSKNMARANGGGVRSISILFENENLLVIDKPAGLIVHSDGRTNEPSVARWMLENYPELRVVGEPWMSPQSETVLRPGIVHRLDRTTSGVMVLAKTPAAYAFLKEQFQSRSVKKEYRAYVYGHVGKDHGTIEAEIVRIRSMPPRWGTQRSGEGKKHRQAITEWQTLARGADNDSGEKASLLGLFPRTGRTHQLRVHLKHINHPVICDPLYAAGKRCLLGFSRPALHALRLAFTAPGGEHHTFEAPLPEDFLKAAQRMQPSL